MAPRNYDVLLHSRKKSKKVTQMNRTITPKHMQNNNKRYQQKYFISSKDLRQQKRNKIEQQSTPLTSSVKNRLTLNTNNVLLRRNNASSSQNNTIVKNVQKTEQGKEIKLFTKHFDARSKLSSKKLTSPGKKKMKNIGKSSEEIVSLSKGLAKKALDDVRSNMRSSAVSQHIDFNKKTRHSITSAKKQNIERETTFTGKSIQVKTKNTLANKERESHLKGNSLSVVTNNVSKQTVQQKSHTLPRLSVNNRKPLPRVADPPVIAKKPTPAKMIISNLHQNVTQEDIKELFGAIGKLKDACLKNIGTAEVIYVDSEDAFQAYNKYNTRNLDGQPMILKLTTVEESTINVSSAARNSNQYSSLSVQSVQDQYDTSLRNRYSGIPQNNHNQMPANGNSGKPVVFTVRL